LGNSSTVSAQDFGIQRVHQILTQSFGVPTDSFRQDDGSGLSRHNLLSTEALSTLLRSWRNKPHADLYKTFLPVGGVSGSLIHRFTNMPGVVHAKTGSMSGVSSLSGYIDKRPTHPEVVFSIIVNGFTEGSFSKNLDAVVVAMSKLTNDC